MPDYSRSRNREESDGFFCRFTFGQFFALLVIEVFTLFFVFYLGAKYGQEFLGMEKGQVASESSEVSEPSVLTTSDPEGIKAAEELMAKAKTPELKERIKQMLANSQDGSVRPNVIEKNLAGDQLSEGGIQVVGGGTATTATAVDSAETAVTPANEGRIISENTDYQAVGQVQPNAGQQENPEGGTPANLAQSEAMAAGASTAIRVKSPANGRYSVQIGSYPTLQEAEKTVESWKSKGYPAYVMVADIPDRGRWYRVRMGGFENRNDATRYLREIQSQESVEALVVLNEQ